MKNQVGWLLLVWISSVFQGIIAQSTGWNYTWPVSTQQCQNVTIAITGGVAPWIVGLVPIGGMPIVWTINGDSSGAPTLASPLTATIPIQFPANTYYSVVVADHNGMNGGPNAVNPQPLQIVRQSTDASCLTNVPSVKQEFTFQLTGNTSQCGNNLVFNWRDYVGRSPYSFTVVPLDGSYWPWDVDLAGGVITQDENSWKVNMTTGTKFTVVMTNDNGWGRGGVGPVYEVAAGNNASCVSQVKAAVTSFPSAVTASPLPSTFSFTSTISPASSSTSTISYTNVISSASRSSSTSASQSSGNSTSGGGSTSSGPGVGVIVGAAAGGAVVLIVIAGLIWFFLRRRKNRSTTPYPKGMDVDGPNNRDQFSGGMDFISSEKAPKVEPFNSVGNSPMSSPPLTGALGYQPHVTSQSDYITNNGEGSQSGFTSPNSGYQNTIPNAQTGWSGSNQPQGQQVVMPDASRYISSGSQPYSIPDGNSLAGDAHNQYAQNQTISPASTSTPVNPYGVPLDAAGNSGPSSIANQSTPNMGLAPWKSAYAPATYSSSRVPLPTPAPAGGAAQFVSLGGAIQAQTSPQSGITSTSGEASGSPEADNAMTIKSQTTGVGEGGAQQSQGQINPSASPRSNSGNLDPHEDFEFVRHADGGTVSPTTQQQSAGRERIDLPPTYDEIRR